MNRSTTFLLAAAKLARENGNLYTTEYDPEKTGLYIGAGECNGLHADNESSFGMCFDFFPGLDVSFDFKKGDVDYQKFGEDGLMQLHPYIALIHLPRR